MTADEIRIMKSYRIEIKTTEGWAKYGCTLIYAQALAIQYQLEQKGYEVRLYKGGILVGGSAK